MDGYTITQILDNLKSKNQILRKEISHRFEVNALTASGTKKRQAIQKLNSETEKLVEEYNQLYPQIEDWIKTSFDNTFAKIILNYYSDINCISLQDTIDSLFPPRVVAINKDEAVLKPFMYASNIRKSLKKAWLNKIVK